MNYSILVQAIAEALGECDDKLWSNLTNPERERYVIRAVLIADRVMHKTTVLAPSVSDTDHVSEDVLRPGALSTGMSFEVGSASN
jgi:chorismate-pyruvate lyase